MKRNKRRLGLNHLVLGVGIAMMLYMFGYMRLHFILIKIVDGIISAAMLKNTYYLSLFSIFFALTIFIIYSIVKWTIVDTLFPYIVLVDENNNKKVFRRAWLPDIFGYRVLKVKFKLAPILDFDKLVLDGAEHERKVRYVYVYSKNLKWDSKERAFIPCNDEIPTEFEDVGKYRYFVKEMNELIGVDVGKAVAGNPDIRKEKYEEGLPNPKEK